jgi:hypothetical protein
MARKCRRVHGGTRIVNVLIIPEDFRKDQHVLKPIVKAMMAACGKPRANVRMCLDPLLGGIDQALDWQRISEILDLNRGMVDLFLLCVDRDGKAGRRVALDNIENLARSVLRAPKTLMAVDAWQEIEVWCLAGLNLLPGWKWTTIRQEPHPKETYFLPLAEQRRLLDEPGEGRKTLTIEAVRNYEKIRQRCPEDVTDLEDRIRRWLGERT